MKTKTRPIPLNVDVRVMLGGKDNYPIAGIGVIWLLEGIERHRSISRAARDMDLSYPKALRIIRNLENGLGRQVVVRHRGGSERGGAELTPLGRDFARRFFRTQERIRSFACKAFEKEFSRSLLRRPSG